MPKHARTITSYREENKRLRQRLDFFKRLNVAHVGMEKRLNDILCQRPFTFRSLHEATQCLESLDGKLTGLLAECPPEDRPKRRAESLKQEV